MNERLSFSTKGSFTIPLLAAIPHTSTYIPADIRPRLFLDDRALVREILTMTDSYVDELMERISELGGVAVTFQCSRLVIDPERFDDDTLEVMAPRGMGVIYIRTARGNPLRPAPSPDERRQLLTQYYKPYHEHLANEVEICLQRFDRCLILDCHSFPSHPLPCDLDQDPGRPDICIGTDPFHTPDQLAILIKIRTKESHLA